MQTVQENIGYKTQDHLFRSKDEYAQGKYDLTTRWLKPRARPGQLLLNIGCGSGDYNPTAHAMGLRVVACEPERQAYALADHEAPRGEPACRVLNCGLMELGQQAPELADFAVMHDVLEHIEDESSAVAALAARLRPGATAIVSVPAYQWLFGHHDVQLGHYRRYTKGQLVRALASEFEIEAARYYGASLIPVALYFSRLSKKGYPVAQASQGVVNTMMRWVCQTESRLPMPAGTSVLVRARKK